MKRMLLTLCLMFSATYAHAYGVIIGEPPILIGPFAGSVYNEFTDMLSNSGATRCDVSRHSSCVLIHFSAVTGKRGRSRYAVGVATFIYFNTDTNELRFTEAHVVRSLAHLVRSKWGGLFTPEQWEILELGSRVESAGFSDELTPIQRIEKKGIIEHK